MRFGAAREGAGGQCGDLPILQDDTASEREMEVEAGDTEAFPEVEGVGIVAMGAGVEREGVAGGGAGVLDEPAEHGFAVAEGAGGGSGDEVVDVEGFAGGKHELGAEAGDGGDEVVVLERGKAVALELLGADAIEKGGFGDMRAELMEDRKAAEDIGVGGDEIYGHWSFELGVFWGVTSLGDGGGG